MTPETRRLARRLAFSAGAAALAYATSGASARSVMRLPLSLLALASVGNLAIQASTASKARVTEQRLAGHITATAPAINLVNNGGTIGGALTVNGDHQVNGRVTTTNGASHGGNIAMNGNGINTVASLAGSGTNIAVNSSGFTMNAGNIDMVGNNLNRLQSISSNGGNIPVNGGGFNMNGNIDMQGNNLNNLQSISTNGGNLPVNGGGINMNGNLDMQNHNINDINTLNGTIAISVGPSIKMLGNINMNGHNCNNGTSYT